LNAISELAIDHPVVHYKTGDADWESALDFLAANGLATINSSSNEAQLSAQLTDAVVELSEPINLNTSRWFHGLSKVDSDEVTTMELRCQLVDLGWDFPKVGSPPNVFDQIMLKVQTHWYFSILLTHPADKLDVFWHRGSIKYFESLDLVLKGNGKSEQVPVQQPADFYDKLCKFLTGQLCEPCCVVCGCGASVFVLLDLMNI
jgi:hypothetical protein